MRRALLLGACLAVLPGAGPRKIRSLPGADVELHTIDGWTIKGKHRLSQAGMRTFILLHGTGQRKEIWYHLCRYLSKAGYGYLAIDARGHGESATGPDGQPLPWRKFRATKHANDFADIALDVQAALAYLAENATPASEVGLIGTDVGGSVALKYAAVHPEIPLVVLFSPGMSYQEVLTVNAMRAYKDRPILLVYSERDKTSSKATPILYEFAKRSAGERNSSLIAVPHIHGVKLPLNGPVLRQVLDWIEHPVKPEMLPEEASEESFPDDASGDAHEEPGEGDDEYYDEDSGYYESP